MINKLYEYVKEYLVTNSVKVIISTLVFGIGLGLGTNKMFGYMIDTHTQLQFAKLDWYEKSNDEHLTKIETSIATLAQGQQQENVSNAELAGKLSVMSDQLDAVSHQTFDNYKLNRKLLSQRKPIPSPRKKTSMDHGTYPVLLDPPTKIAKTQ